MAGWHVIPALRQTRVSLVHRGTWGSSSVSALVGRISIRQSVVEGLATVTKGPSLQTATTTSQQVQLVFDQNVALTGVATAASSWTMTPSTGSTGVPVTVTGVSVSSKTVTLTTTVQTGGQRYTLVIPASVISAVNGLPMTTASTQVLVGSGTTTPILAVTAVDAETLIVVFSRVVQATGSNGALNASNWSLSPSIAVLSVTQVSPTTFQLKTAQQSTGTLYTLTASGIVDLAGNPI